MTLDITLPCINGLEACKDIRSDEKTKIIAISRDLRYSEAEVLGAWANVFFTKPVNFVNLLSICSDFLEQPKSLE